MYGVPISEDLVAGQTDKGRVKLHKFSCIGFVILEKAKLFMHKTIRYDIER